MPRIVGYTIDGPLAHHNIGALNWIFWSILALYAFRGMVSFALNYLMTWLGQRIVFDLRFQSYRHLNRLSLAYYDTRQTGKIMARLTSDIDTIQYMISGGFVTFLADLFSVLALLIVLFYNQWKLALVAMAIVPLYVVNYKLLIRHRQMHIGELLAFNGWVAFLYDPAVRLVDFNVTLQWAGAALDRIFETLDTRPEIDDAPNAVPLRQMAGAVNLEGVSFGYDR